MDVLELAHPGKPQGRKKTICALASGVWCRAATKRSNGAIASAAVAMTGGANSALKEFHLTGPDRRRGFLGRD